MSTIDRGTREKGLSNEEGARGVTGAHHCFTFSFMIPRESLDDEKSGEVSDGGHFLTVMHQLQELWARTHALADLRVHAWPP